MTVRFHTQDVAFATNRKLKVIDKDLTMLLEQLPDDTPDEFSQVIISAAQYVPQERSSLVDLMTMLI